MTGCKLTKSITYFCGENFGSTEKLKDIALRCQTPYLVLCFQKDMPEISRWTTERFVETMQATHAVVVYSDYYESSSGILKPHPLIDYQEGSLRNDFNFGGMIFVETEAYLRATADMKEDYKFAAFYDLRLKLSRIGRIFRLPELLYTVERQEISSQFDYVNPQNRPSQIEMEKACTEHLKTIGGFIKATHSPIKFDDYTNFPVEMSVIIPVKNRVRTIADAILSALKQKTEFIYNIIVVDNHSTDGTSSVISQLADDDARIVHIIPKTDTLQIGGCWNLATEHEMCGRFCVQLDSDDLYIDENVLQKIADKFHETSAAAVIGSYRLTNFNLEEIPPGVIDHREWSDENGANNGLRINGFGAPRAYFTPIIRSVKFPNVSYGEDYSAILSISTLHNIGRIYEPLYLCRRWEDNTDAQLDVEKANKNDFYKDRIRTMELLKRINSNSLAENI
ncbi:MAG: glycosyltransferase family 2 protein [Culturomica sp.]|jgi:hypothetical protein|nr:glycosyltransferase family 2 protein [Culturomica sp.]